MHPTPGDPDGPERPERPEPPEPEPPGSAPPPARRSCEPWATALANASLLGVGYAMLGRWWLALSTAAVTVILVALLASVAQSGGWYAAVLLWWAAVTAHGWYLAGGRARRTDPDTPLAPLAQLAPPPRPALGGVNRQWLLAAGVTIPVLLTFASLRVDAAAMEGDAAEAHRAGECVRALSILDGLEAAHRVVDAGLVAHAEDTIAACELLVAAQEQAEDDDRLHAAQTFRTYAAHPAAEWEGAPGRRAELFLTEATEELYTALGGQASALAVGLDHLATVLREFPGREGEVDDVLDTFLAALPVEDACDTKNLTDWLASQPGSGDTLDRAADVVPRIAPAAIVGCGDAAMADDDWDQARERYRQLLDEYPDHELATEAEDGTEQATLAIELDRLRGLLQPEYPGEEPAYCDDPAPYSGAEPYGGGGPNQALLFGRFDHKKRLPESWLADGAEDAVLVICAGESKHGTGVATCAYEYEPDIEYAGGVQPTRDVTFHKKRVPVRVYEVRTGERVDIRTIEIGGTSCPDDLWYEYYHFDAGPPADVYVRSSPEDVRAAYDVLINP